MIPLRAVLALGAVVAVAGCSSQEKSQPALPRTNPASVLDGDKKKEEGIIAETKGIIANPTDSVFVAASAERIMDLIRLAPHAKVEATVKALVSERDAAIRANASIRDALDAANKQIEEQKNALLRKTALGIVGVSLLTLLLCAGAVYFAPNKLRALGDAGPIALCAVLGIGLAQVITRPWFVPACCTIGALAVAAGIWWAIRKNSEGKLAAALKERAEATAAVAAKTIPAIDATYDAMREGAVTTAEDVFKELYSRLSGKMNEVEKARVHSIRAEVKAATAS